MLIDSEETASGKIATAFITAALGAIGAVAIEAFDYFIWNISWFEASSFPEYLKKVWFIPLGCAIMCGIIGLIKGEKAYDFVEKIWDQIS